MASSNLNQQQFLNSQEANETEQVFATLQLETAFPKGREILNHLGRNYSSLSDHHRRYLKIQHNEQMTTSSTINPVQEEFCGKWNITYNTKGNDFLLLLGKGSPLYGVTRGVDIFIDCPATWADQIAPVHALLRIHPQSGFLTIEGIDDDHPVCPLLDNVPVVLGAGKRHCLWQSVNRFSLSGAEFKLTYAQLDKTGLAYLREVRDSLCQGKGFPVPDARLPIFPPPQHERDQKGNCLLFGIVGSGSYGIVRLGVDITTGDTCAVKSIEVKHVFVREEVLNEAFILLSYPGQTGLLQASVIACDHGKQHRARQSGNIHATFASCQGLDAFHFFTPFATGGDFSTVQLNENNIRDIVKLLRGPIEGLKFLHDEGWIHRDVTCRNMLIMADGCGVLGDFGKILIQGSTTSNTMGPSHTRAPETDGTSVYGQSADVWSLAFAIVRIFFKDLYSWPTFNANRPQNKAWSDEATRKLSQLSQQSALHFRIMSIVVHMLEYEPHNRPTMKEVLTRWSALDLNAADTTEALENGGPPTKFQKTTVNARIAREAPQPLTRPVLKRIFPAVPSNLDMAHQIQNDIHDRRVVAELADPIQNPNQHRAAVAGMSQPTQTRKQQRARNAAMSQQIQNQRHGAVCMVENAEGFVAINAAQPNHPVLQPNRTAPQPDHPVLQLNHPIPQPNHPALQPRHPTPQAPQEEN